MLFLIHIVPAEYFNVYGIAGNSLVCSGLGSAENTVIMHLILKSCPFSITSVSQVSASQAYAKYPHAVTDLE